MTRLSAIRCGSIVFCVFAIPLAAGGDDKKPQKERRDYAGTSVLMGQFRALFDAWDLNKDGNLDRHELAKAFRGANATAYKPASDDKLTAKARASKYPDYEFLIELDQNRDGKISRTEFIDWARSFALEWRHLKTREQSIARLQRSLQGRLATAEREKLSAEIKQEREAATEQRKAMRFLQTMEKHLKSTRK
jgi:EF-hand domain pair